MRIAQIAPLYESCPPRLYGGTERVVSYLTEKLVRMGHDVTLFASGDSKTAARLISPCRRALRLNASVTDPLAYHMIMMAQVLQEADRFDILHFHTDYLHFPAFANGPHPIVTTLHGRQDLADLAPLYREFCATPLVSISNEQRRPLPRAHWIGTVYHGLPADLLPAGPGDGGYLAFVGRMSPEKRPDRAIEIARRAGMPLRIAAKIDRADRDYFETFVAPLLEGGDVEFVGEIDEEQKKDFLGRAAALLFPIDWPEPFGLVMIEAMACGTPVLAFNRGSIPEILDETSGAVVGSMEEAHAALPRLLNLDRRAIRCRFEERFSSDRMAQDYVTIYEGLARRTVPVETQIDLIPQGIKNLYPSLGKAPAAHAASVSDPA